MTDVTQDLKVLRIDWRLHERLRKLAQRERRTLTAQTELVIEKALREAEQSTEHDAA